MIEPREIIPASADVVRKTEGRIDASKEAGREELAGVEERGMHTSGLPRNLGGLVVSVRKSREGHPVEQPRRGSGALAVPGSEGRAHARYRQAKGTKRGGKDGQETEHSVVPTKRGNSPQGDPGEGRGQGVVESWLGNRRGLRAPAVGQRKGHE